jgi:hypothetical protein
MILKRVLIPLLCLYIMGFKQVDTNLSPSQHWARAFNASTDSLMGVYHSRAYLLASNGNAIRCRQGIMDYYAHKRSMLQFIQCVKTITEVTDRVNPEVKYKIGSFVDAHGVDYKHITIWQISNDSILKRFGFYARADSTPACTAPLVDRRKDWAEGSSSHNAHGFVLDLYSPDAIYLCLGADSIYIGNAAVAQAYEYMNDSTWHAYSLTPLHVEPVNSSMVFEIGTYSCSFGVGEYIIIWKLSSEGVWQVCFDSNY